jgi:hypothetical protein
MRGSIGAAAVIVVLWVVFIPEGGSSAPGNPKNKTFVVTHHKSGTVLSLLTVIAECCCPVLTTSDELAKRRGNGKLKWLFDRWAECKLQANEMGVWFEPNGFFQGFPPPRDMASSTVVHYIRNPIDMLVSGYLYHRACREPWTQRKLRKVRSPGPDPQLDLMNVGPRGSHYGFEGAKRYLTQRLGNNATSFCAGLQQVTGPQGIAAEALRTFHASDGIGQMLYVHHQLNLMATQLNIRVVVHCMGVATDDTAVRSALGLAARPPAQDKQATASHSTHASDPGTLKNLCLAAEHELRTRGIFDTMDKMGFTCPPTKCI